MENANGWDTYAAGYKGWGIAKFGITHAGVVAAREKNWLQCL